MNRLTRLVLLGIIAFNLSTAMAVAYGRTRRPRPAPRRLSTTLRSWQHTKVNIARKVSHAVTPRWNYVAHRRIDIDAMNTHRQVEAQRFFRQRARQARRLQRQRYRRMPVHRQPIYYRGFP